MRSRSLLRPALLALAAVVSIARSPAHSQTFADVSALALPGIENAPGAIGIPPGFMGGAAVGDCDGDGLADLYFTGRAHDVLYRNRGDGTFTDGTVAANLGHAGSTSGAAFGDLDRDGDLDLFVTSVVADRHYLFINQGDCAFVEDAIARGASGSSLSTGRSVSFGDYDRDGYLDVYVSEVHSPLITPVVVPTVGRLLRNRGAAAPGFFDDVTIASGVSVDATPGPQVGTFPMSALFSDLDGDGWPDLTITADYRESRLFWNDGTGGFIDGTTAAGVATEEHGMGSVTADLDGDGNLDLFVTSTYLQGDPRATGNRLYRNLGTRTFADVSTSAVVRDGGLGWGADALDADNDGDLDLVQTNGGDADDHPLVGLDLPGVDLTAWFKNDPVRLWRNDGTGVFNEIAAAVGLVDQGVGQGAITFDYDADGDVDILLTHQDGDLPPRLYRNNTTSVNHWLAIELVADASAPRGIGARVTVTPTGRAPIIREVAANGTYLAQNGTGRLHFGLGASTHIDTVHIAWPSGTDETIRDLAPDTAYRIREVPGTLDQSAVQRECIAVLNRAGAKVAGATAKRFASCIAGATRRTLPPGQSVTDCLGADPAGAIARFAALTVATATVQCPVRPVFGPREAFEMNAAMEAVLRAPDLFGGSLDTALIDARSDGLGASCQVAFAKAAAKVALAKLKAFNACKLRGLLGGTITSTSTLAACRAALSGGKVAALTSRMQRLALRRCGHTPVATAFPGRCANVPLSSLATCLVDQVDCSVCASLNAADHLPGPCHHFTSGVATVYCGNPPVTTGSTARQWNEELLAAIRRDTPRPTVHARNLFHLSAAMWDAWRAYGGGGAAWLTAESPATSNPESDRAIAISFAAYRILAARFAAGPGTVATQASLRARMEALGYDVGFTSTAGSLPAAVGNRIGAAMLAFGLADGSNEQSNYADPTYTPANQPLTVKAPGTVMANPNRWQPLALDLIIAQNGVPLPGNVQTAIGARWNGVTPFALTRANPADVYIDPGPPPLLGGAGDAGFKDGARIVLEYSGQLNPFDGASVDISPGARGNNPLGSNAGTGHPTNPVSGLPYAPNVVPRGDFLRVLAEFWADGPASETPPGHWNVLANQASDALAVHQIGGTGPAVPRLEWDVKLYFALNGAVHDAAIAAWGLKRKYDSPRPISMIRYLAGRGQSSDMGGPSYDPEGLPLVPGLIEVITATTTAPGERHDHLAGHEGEIAVLAYPGPPSNPADGPFAAVWSRGIEWTTYQRRTFVTPAFPGFTSGHSTFSRAAAEVMTRFTGSAFVPGGLGSFHAAANTYLSFERGPSVDVDLQWATYYDAADLAGLSRIPGGIHVPEDDFHGRIIGSTVGIAAFDRALAYFAGTR